MKVGNIISFLGGMMFIGSVFLETMSVFRDSYIGMGMLLWGIALFTGGKVLKHFEDKEEQSK